jgi:hypothetical protein
MDPAPLPYSRPRTPQNIDQVGAMGVLSKGYNKDFGRDNSFSAARLQGETVSAIRPRLRTANVCPPINFLLRPLQDLGKYFCSIVAAPLPAGSQVTEMLQSATRMEQLLFGDPKLSAVRRFLSHDVR